MKVGIGSQNKTKIEALERILQTYPLFEGCDVVGVVVDIEEFGHPKSLADTVDGAISRAKQAYVGYTYGFGIEGGLMTVPHTKTGYMEVAACAIFDGKDIHLGLSPAFEWPKDVLNKILYEGLDGSQAIRAAGLTDEIKLGEKKGMIDILTHGRMDRTTYNALAITMALTHLANPEYF